MILRIVIISLLYRPKYINQPGRVPVWKTLRRDNRGQISILLPSLAVYNHRSIWKKINNFATEFIEMGVGVAFHSEVWEKKQKKKHQYKIQELFEIKGIGYVSTPRIKKTGGGSAITIDIEKYTMKEVKIDNPDNLEVP